MTDFDNLAYKSIPELMEATDLLGAMADELDSLMYRDAADDTRLFTVALEELQHLHEALEPVWKMVEWYKDERVSRKDVQKAVKHYRNMVV